MPVISLRTHALPLAVISGFTAPVAQPELDQGWLNTAGANWDSLGLPQLLVGECDWHEHGSRVLVPDVATTVHDDPCLRELLQAAALRLDHDWLLLLGPDVAVSPEGLHALRQLCRPGTPARLVIGRAWRLAEPPGDDLMAAIEAEGCLDPPERLAWALLPRDRLLAAPAELGCSPEQAIPWLIAMATALGWPVLEATAAVMVARPVAPAAPLKLPQRSVSAATAVVLPHRPGDPLLSLLLAAPEAALDQIQQQLLPTLALPWEVIARPAEPADGPGAISAAWASGLQVARGALAWPITQAPPLALIPAVLRCFDAPGVDLLQLAWQMGSQLMPAVDPLLQEPGCLVGQSPWFRRAGGFADGLSAPGALLQVRQRARRRGALCRSLPLSALQRNAATVATAL
jgi:hypothetical protein